jgi:ElaB/YqjD/DUF883 family membrane-anchored ribosome-binding protein
MKRFISILIISTVVTINLYGQTGTFKTVPATYSFSTSSPLLFVKGDTLQVTCDSVYLMNVMRYNFYKNIHKATLSEKDSVCSRLLNAYELRLLEHEQAYNKLLDNSKQAEKISLDLISYSQKSLAGTQKTLEFTQTTLDQSLKSIDMAHDYIQQQKWNSKGQKVLVGVCGIGIGLLVGVLIAK